MMEMEFTLMQKEGESLEAYMERASLEVETLEREGIQLKPQLVALKFLRGLRGTQFQRKVAEWCADEDIPQDLTAAKEAVYKWYAAHVGTGATMGEAAVFATTAADREGSEKGGKKKAFRGNCNLCGEKGHMMKDCPDMPKAREAVLTQIHEDEFERRYREDDSTVRDVVL